MDRIRVAVLEATGIVMGSGVPEDLPRDIDIVFSALPSSIAGDVEIGLVRRGFTVISNASPMRLDPDVPLPNPEVNHGHLKALELPGVRRGWSGALLKDPSCTSAILTLSLVPSTGSSVLRALPWCLCRLSVVLALGGYLPTRSWITRSPT